MNDPEAKLGNYTVTTNDGTLTINPAPLTGTADNKSRECKQTNPAFTVVYSGFVNGESSAIVSGTLTGSTTATVNSAVGTYPITLAGQSAPNYTITYVPGVLTIVDTTAPVVALNGNASVNVECHAAYSEFGATAVDACAGSLSVSTTGSVNANAVGNYTITYTAVDPSGNTSSATRVVYVVDTTIPIVTLNGGASLNVECHTAYIEQGATAVDTCAGSLPVSTSGSVNTNAVGDYTITYTAADPSANTSSATRVVHVIDTTIPIVTLNGSATINVECHSAYNEPGATANDSCAGVVSVFTSGSVDTNNVGDYTLTYAATDATGNSASTTRVVHVVDTAIPVITLNDSASLNLECHTAYTEQGATAVDACAGSLSVSTAGGVNTNGVGNYTLIYTATDPSGNSSSAIRVVHVVDTTLPVVTLNGNASVNVECHGAYAEQGATAVDTCAGNISVATSGSVDANAVGDYTITYTATDPSGNTASATRVVHVTDTTIPIVTLNGAASVSVECHSGYTESGATANDACAGSLIVTTSGGVNTNSVGNYTLTYTATDASGNFASTTRVVQVADSIAPSISGVPGDATVQCDSVPIAVTAVATDNCDSNPQIIFNESRVDGSCSNAYTLIRTWTATDAAGNSSSKTQTIAVIDTTAPIIAGVPMDTTVQCDAVPVAAAPTATDACDSHPQIVFNEVSTPGSCNGSYVLTRTWMATDLCGNSSSNVQTITVVDTTAPVLADVPNNVTVECSNIPAAATPTATDNCDQQPVITLNEVSTRTSAGCGQFSYTITRTWTATDVCGNASSAQQMITVHDTVAPALSAPPADATAQCDSIPAAATLTATDNCDMNPAVTFAESIAAGSCSGGYVLTRTWTATDACGNTSSKMQKVTVIDTTAPVLAGIPDDATVQCDAVPSAATATAIDNCDNNPNITFNETRAAGSCSNSYTLTRTWTATDACGNTSSKTQTIAVIDTTAPVISGVPDDTTVQCDIVPVAAAPTATDTCDANPQITYNETTTPGLCAGMYILTRTWTATDVCGNSTSKTQMISVIDTVAPVLAGVPTDITTQCNDVPVAATPTTTDNCDSAPQITFNETIAAGSCAGTYAVVRTWIATDACGNASSASQTITVVDSISPVLVDVPSDTTAQCNAIPAAANPHATDNCDANPQITFNETRRDGPCLATYELTRTWVATDACGNSSSKSQKIAVINTVAPILAGVPDDVTVQCDAVPSPATPGAIDNCDANPQITLTETNIAGSCSGTYLLTRTWTATDVCGNTSSKSQQITVISTTPPVLSGVPDDTTAQCDAVPLTATPTATANCDSNPQITLDETTTTGPCIGSYILTRTWTATDACGNTASATQTISVIDTSAPTFANVPADATAQCDSVPASVAPTATDNCDANPQMTLIETTTPGVTPNDYTLTRIWTATDACGNSSTAQQVVAIVDNTAPVLSGVPSDMTVTCDSLPAAAAPTASDNCDQAPLITLTESSTQTSSGCTHESYIVSRTWTARDASGNQASATQQITMTSIAPTIAVFPADATYSCAKEVPPANNGLVAASSTCGGAVVITHDADVIADKTCNNRFNITRIYHATTACGDVATRSQSITVFDTNAPVITKFPADTNYNCLCYLPQPNDKLVTATDTCGTNVTISHLPDVTTNIVDDQHFEIVRTYIATDACGNSSSRRQTFHMSLAPAPTITITHPNVRVGNPSYAIQGTAHSDLPLKGVYYSLNNSPYQLATGTKVWNVNLHLQLGTNTISVYALDAATNSSAISNATVSYVIFSVLKIVTTDWPGVAKTNSGIFTPNLNGGTLEVGKDYTITAAPGIPLHRFVGWATTSDLKTAVFATSPTLTFTMKSNLVLVARFENPFFRLTGTWSGLFAEPAGVDPRSAGFITFGLPGASDKTVTTFSGKIMVNGKNYPISSRFDADGHSHFTVTRKGLGNLTVDLYVDALTATNIATGTVSSSEWTANVTAYHAIATDEMTSVSQYTMALASSGSQLPMPNGWGTGTIKQAKSGVVAISGSLADGSAYAPQAVRTSRDGHWPLYAQLYKNTNGILWGWLQFTNAEPAVTGELVWFRPQGLSKEIYPAGFNSAIHVIGSRYTNSSPYLDWPTGTVSLYDGHDFCVSNTVHLASNIVTVVTDPNYPVTNKLALTINKLNGLVTGRFESPYLQRTNAIRGVLLQNQGVAAGQFGSANAGAFLMQAP